MKSVWQNKIRKEPAPPSFFAPDWYTEAKTNGASEEALYKLVQDFCRESLKLEAEAQGKNESSEPDDALVKMMIATYEAG